MVHVLGQPARRAASVTMALAWLSAAMAALAASGVLWLLFGPGPH